MKKTQLAIVAVLFFIVPTTLFLLTRPAPEVETRTVRVLCAGSLLYPMERVVEAFEEEHPEIDVELEGHGSIQVIRHPTELDDQADLLMVADYSLIPVMMYNKTVPGTDEKFADWYVRFSGNSVVLAYTGSSLYSDEIGEDNWFEILARPDVKIGIPNPIIDALGYRSLMILQLAEEHYGEGRIFEDVLGSHFDPEFESVAVGNRTVIFVPEVEKPVGGKISVRASSIQIIPLLESGAIDYSFLYLSNARQYGIEYLELPDEIDLGLDEDESSYAGVQVRFQHARFSSIGLDRWGKPIHYGLTIPKNAANPEDAELLVEYLLAGRGREILDSLWHPVYEPSYTDNLQALPEGLLTHVVQEALSP